MSAKTQSYLIHFCAGVVIVILPLLLASVPASWQEMTVGGVLGLVLKFAHDAAGY